MITHLFHNRNLRCLLIGQSISSLGDYMATIALTALVYQRTGSALNVAIVYSVTILPAALGIFIGPKLKYWSLRKVMIVSDLIQTVIMILIPWVASLYLASVYLLLFLSTILSVVFQSARLTLLADVSDTAKIDKVNSLDQTLQLISPLLGMALGGSLSTLSFTWAFWIDGITFFLSALLISRITIGRKPMAKERVPQSNFFRELKVGFKYIGSQATLCFNVYGNFLVNFGVGAYNAMLIIYAYSHLHKGMTGYTTLLIGQYAGLGLSGIWFSLFKKKYSKGLWLASGNVAMGVFIATFAVTHSLGITILLSFFIGGFNLITNTLSRTMLMETSEPEMRGAVMNVRIALGRPINTLGALLAGFLATSFLNVSHVILLSGLAIGFFGLLAFFIPSIIHYGEFKPVGMGS